MTKILFLEDEKTIREVIAEYMTLTGYQVTCCENGDDAISLVENNIFDLAVLDIRVPGASGLQVLEYIRNSKQKDMGVIMLTAFEDEATQVDAFNHFADDYITKPASPIILLKRIEVLKRRIGQTSEEIPNNLIVDKSAYRVLFEGKDLQFTLTEFLIFKTIMDHPNQVFTREQLISQVFDDEYFGSDRIIDAHVKNIRKKLPYNTIETVIGLGYRWKGDK